MKKILIVEDDPSIAKILSLYVKDAGYQYEVVLDGSEGLEKARSGNFDLVILDVMLPGMNGLDVCKEIRKTDSVLPILFLTSMADDVDKVIGLELGADDYVTKPFSGRVLLAQIRSILRRAELSIAPKPEEKVESVEAIETGDLNIDFGRRRVTKKGEVIELSSVEFDALAFLAQRPGRPFTRDDLLTYVWGLEYSGYEHSVNTCICRLRAKLEDDPSKPRYILTVWGFGYRFSELGDGESVEA